ncbi:MAG: hypothetical protein HY716_08920 [Planctomycetes bacterium]|nr:hypothetical protein [Planctomycetota bacterium]
MTLLKLAGGSLVLSTLAAAQEGNPAAPTSILWASSWESALREAGTRHVPIMILVSSDEACPACRKLEAQTLPDPQLIAASHDMVAVAAHRGRRHGTLEIGGSPRCKIYPPLECADHERTADVGLNFLRGRLAPPAMIWCDASGRELFKRAGYCSASQMIEDLRAALGRMPGSRIPRTTYAIQGVPLERAEKAAARRRWKEAILGFMQAREGPIARLKKAAEEGLAEIAKVGEQLLKEARAYLEISDPESALPYLKLLVEEFDSFESGRNAASLLKKLNEK